MFFLGGGGKIERLNAVRVSCVWELRHSVCSLTERGEGIERLKAVRMGCVWVVIRQSLEWDCIQN